jgi:CRISPR-associated protein Cmr2
MNYVLIINVGPVQGFIAAARKARDLQYGSWMLSELVKVAALAIGVERLIFPAPPNEATLRDKRYQVGNRLLALVDEPAAVAQAAEAALHARLEELWHEAQKKIGGPFERALAVAQIAELPEFSWAAARLRGDDGAAYNAAREQAERALAARKATRDFGPVNWPEASISLSGNKSSIDGQRTAVIPRTCYVDRRKDDAQAEARKAQQMLHNYGAGAAEYLSGVDLLKRRGALPDGSHFASTSAVAARSLATRLSAPEAAAAWQSYVTFVRTHSAEQIEHRDQHEELLFSERLADYLSDKTQLEEARRILAALLRDHAGGAQPQPYYALLHADGDNMGRALDRAAQQGHERHRALSQALDCFAQGVRKTVETDHKGVLIYAGGDDVLALLPLHTALDCTRALADAFYTALHTFSLDTGGSPTLSAGLVLAHHTDPLSDALDSARRAEKQAKQLKDKNGLCVIASKRSGADRVLHGTLATLVERLQVYSALLRDREIAGGFAYEIQRMARSTPEAAQLGEALRILDRKRRQRGLAALDETTRSQVVAQIALGGIAGLPALALELIVAQMFADAQRLVQA